MHPISFLQKRAHLCAVARGRQMFERVEEMTPARFDILYLIHKNVRQRGGQPSGPFWMYQADVTKALGLARQTIWKMVERLVELGLLTKRRCTTCRTHNVLALTEEGVRRTRRALNTAFTESAPLPRDAPATGDVPRYWRRPELADPPPPPPSPPRMPFPWLEEGDASEATVESEKEPEPETVERSPSAPSDEELARMWRAYIGPEPTAKEPVDAGPKTTGREVANIYSSYAWQRMVRHGKRTGRRGRRNAHLASLETLIDRASDIAAALGNRVESIYTLRFFEEY